MITMIDSNVLIDILGGNPTFGELSANALQFCSTEGALHACEIVWTEVATLFKQDKDFNKVMDTLGIQFSPLNQDSALLAAHAWRHYRQAGGKRDRVSADFLIGAHAKHQGNRLLTRDGGFYRNYFQSLLVIDPSKKAVK